MKFSALRLILDFTKPAPTVNYHPDFWVAAGTAAPVIFLSAILLARELLSTRNELRAIERRANLEKQTFVDYFTVAQYYFVGVAAALQGAVVIWALGSLDDESDTFPLAIVT